MHIVAYLSGLCKAVITGGSLELWQSNRGLPAMLLCSLLKKLSGRCFGRRSLCPAAVGNIFQGRASCVDWPLVFVLFLLERILLTNPFSNRFGDFCRWPQLWCAKLWRQLETKTSTVPPWQPSDEPFKLPVCLGCAYDVDGQVVGQMEVYGKVPPDAFGGLCSKRQLHRILFLINICFMKIT